MDEIAVMLKDSGLPKDDQLEAFRTVLPIATQIASTQNPNAAFGDGQFLATLMEIIKVLLPIILNILKG